MRAVAGWLACPRALADPGRRNQGRGFCSGWSWRRTALAPQAGTARLDSPLWTPERCPPPRPPVRLWRRCAQQQERTARWSGTAYASSRSPSGGRWPGVRPRAAAVRLLAARRRPVHPQPGPVRDRGRTSGRPGAGAVRLAARAAAALHGRLRAAPRSRLAMGLEVELMRQAALVDSTAGIVNFGLDRRWLRALFRDVSREGSWRLVGRSARSEFRHHPASLTGVFFSPGARD